MGNQELLAKADLALADLSANGGVMLPEQSASFIRKLIKTPTLLKQVRTVEMIANERRINKIGFGSRIMRKGTQGTALTSTQRSKPTTEQITMTTKEVIAEIRLPYDVVEDNIERAQAATNSPSNQAQNGGLKDTLISMIAERAALDLEELGLLAATNYTNGSDSDDQDYLSLFDGYIRRGTVSGNVVDNGSAAINKTLFKAGVKGMPDQYLRNRATMKHFVSMDQVTEYQDTLANRPTGMGDQMLQGLATLYAYGSVVEPVMLMPDDKGLFVDPLNLIFGIQRNMSMEYDKDITARVYIIVLTARVAFQVDEAAATVVYTNIGAAE